MDSFFFLSAGLPDNCELTSVDTLTFATPEEVKAVASALTSAYNSAGAAQMSASSVRSYHTGPITSDSGFFFFF